MGRRNVVEKNRVYVECTDMHRRVKAWIISRDESHIKVEFPTGAIMRLDRQSNLTGYKLQVGMLEFICDGKTVV